MRGTRRLTFFWYLSIVYCALACIIAWQLIRHRNGARLVSPERLAEATKIVAKDGLLQTLLIWQRYQQLDDMEKRFDEALAELLTNTQARLRLQYTAEVLSNSLPALWSFSLWLNDTNNGDVLRQLRRDISRETWPLYSVAIRFLQPYRDSSLIIAPSEFVERKFDFGTLWDGSLLWLQQYYLNFGHPSYAVEMWERAAAHRPQLRPVAMYRSLETLWLAGRDEEARLLLRREKTTLQSVPWVAAKTEDLLRRYAPDLASSNGLARL